MDWTQFDHDKEEICRKHGITPEQLRWYIRREQIYQLYVGAFWIALSSMMLIGMGAALWKLLLILFT